MITEVIVSNEIQLQIAGLFVPAQLEFILYDFRGSRNTEGLA